MPQSALYNRCQRCQIKTVDNLWIFCPQRRTDSSCQAGPVSQNQICQRKHDIEFGLLFFKPSVSCLSEAQLLLDDTEYMLHSCPDGRFCVLSFWGGVLSAFEFHYITFSSIWHLFLCGIAPVLCSWKYLRISDRLRDSHILSATIWEYCFMFFAPMQVAGRFYAYSWKGYLCLLYTKKYIGFWMSFL